MRTYGGGSRHTHQSARKAVEVVALFGEGIFDFNGWFEIANGVVGVTHVGCVVQFNEWQCEGCGITWRDESLGDDNDSLALAALVDLRFYTSTLTLLSVWF